MKRPGRIDGILLLALMLLVPPANAHANSGSSLEVLRFSADVDVNVDGVVLADEQVAVETGSTPSGVLSFPDLPDTDLTAYAASSAFTYIAVETAVSVPGSGGSITAEPRDVMGIDRSSPSADVYSLALDGSARGVPDGARVDAIALHDSGDLLVSFDTTITVNSVTADDEDILRYDGSVFTMFFDGTAEGVPESVDLDAVDRRATGALRLSFDTSGTVGMVTFDDEDILEFTFGATAGSGTWTKFYDGSTNHASFGAADIDAWNSPLVQIVGQVTLEGRPSPPHERWSVPLDLNLYPPSGGASLYTCAPMTGRGGAFTCFDIAPLSYAACVKHSHTLRSCTNVDLTLGMNAVDFGTLREGDADGNNCVALVDFSILSTAFATCEGAATFDPRADFDLDGCILLVDFSRLANNFAQCGDDPPATGP